MAVPVLQLCEIKPQKRVQFRSGAVRKVGAGEIGHVLVVAPLAMGVDCVPSLMASQIAVKSWPDVVELVEQGDELVIEVLVEKTRQTKRHHVKHFLVADEITLHLVRNAAPPALKLP